MQITLTADQVAQLQPLLDRSRKPPSPDLLVGAISWAPGESALDLIIDVRLVPRSVGQKMRDTYAKEVAKLVNRSDRLSQPVNASA